MNGERYLQAYGFLLDFGLCTVSHWPLGLGTTGTAQLQSSHTLVIQASISRAHNDAQPRPWLGQHPVCSISAGVAAARFSSSSLKTSFPTKPAKLQIWSCPCAGAAARAGWALAEANPSQGRLSGLWFDTDLPYLNTSKRDAQTSQDPLDQHQGIKGDWLDLI